MLGMEKGKPVLNEAGQGHGGGGETVASAQHAWRRMVGTAGPGRAVGREEAPHTNRHGEFTGGSVNHHPSQGSRSQTATMASTQCSLTCPQDRQRSLLTHFPLGSTFRGQRAWCCTWNAPRFKG